MPTCWGSVLTCFGSDRLAMVRTFGVATGTAAFPLQVQGMDVVSSGNNVRAFTVPEISWEPVLNTAPRVAARRSAGRPVSGPPELMPNYYPDDGGPTRIYNNSVKLVPLAPIPLSKFIVGRIQEPASCNITSSLFTLPFGMRALATLTKFIYPQHPPSIEFNQPAFDNNLKGGLQLQFNAGKLPTDDYPMFTGATAQINNVLDLFGNPTGASTLGQSVTLHLQRRVQAQAQSADQPRRAPDARRFFRLRRQHFQQLVQPAGPDGPDQPGQVRRVASAAPPTK